MIIIGICGGLGSGKSTVVDLLHDRYGARVIKAGEVGHLAFEPGSETYRQITDHFGGGILDEDGNINHRKLADRVFADKNEKAFIDSVIHPFALGFIREKISEWKKQEKSFWL